MLIWSDLILPENFRLPAEPGNYVGISGDFPCRWRFENGVFSEKRSEKYGVAGLFVFKDRSCLDGVPQSGEFVRWLREQNMKFEPLGLAGTREFGTLSEYAGLGGVKTRPFNKITVNGDTVTKEAIDGQGQ
jgi:hypothetical protein